MLTRIRVSVCCLAVLLALSQWTRAEVKGATVLVVPNRYTIVQLAFTMAQMRDVKLVAYERLPKTGDLLMHVWEPTSRGWLKTDVEEYGTGALISDFVAQVVIIGGPNTLPEELVKASDWCARVDPIDSLEIVTLVNSLDEHLTFTPREWRRLAKLYGLKLRDKNEDRRRYGRYGKPGETRAHPVPPGAEQTGADRLPPEGPVEDIAIPEPPEEEKGVPVQIDEPQPAKVEPAEKTAVEEPEPEEAAPLPEDK